MRLNILAGFKIACSDSRVSSCLFLKYVPPVEEIYGECLLVGYVSCARNSHTLYCIPGRGRTWCFVDTFWWGYSYLNTVHKPCLVAWSSCPQNLELPKMPWMLWNSSLFRNEWCLGCNFILAFLQFLSREPGDLAWVVLGKITAQSMAMNEDHLCYQAEPSTLYWIREKYCVARVIFSNNVAMSIAHLGTHGGVSSLNCKANECCYPGKTGQWSYPCFTEKSKAQRRKLFMQGHPPGVGLVLCSHCLASTCGSLLRKCRGRATSQPKDP